MFFVFFCMLKEDLLEYKMRKVNGEMKALGCSSVTVFGKIVNF